MSRNGYSDTERAQCITWSLQTHGMTAVQELFQNGYNRTPPARSTIRQWREDYQSRVLHAHRGGNGRQQISKERRVRIRLLFNDDPQLPFRTVAAGLGVHHTTVWLFYEKD